MTERLSSNSNNLLLGKGCGIGIQPEIPTLVSQLEALNAASMAARSGDQQRGGAGGP